MNLLAADGVGTSFAHGPLRGTESQVLCREVGHIGPGTSAGDFGRGLRAEGLA